MEKINYIGKTLLIEESGRKILAIGDLHLGYEEVLSRGGVFVARQLFKESLTYLDKVFEKVGRVNEVVLLGDVKHEFGKIMSQEWKEVVDLIDYLSEKCSKIIIVKGNHDKIIGPIAEKKQIEVVDYYFFEGFCFLHGDGDFLEIHDKRITCWIMGHAHPAIKISDGVKLEKFKCFLVGKFEGKEVVVVPSFFEGNAGSDPRENDLGLAWKFNLKKFKAKVVSGLGVLDFGLLGKLK